MGGTQNPAPHPSRQPRTPVCPGGHTSGGGQHVREPLPGGHHLRVLLQIGEVLPDPDGTVVWGEEREVTGTVAGTRPLGPAAAPARRAGSLGRGPGFLPSAAFPPSPADGSPRALASLRAGLRASLRCLSRPPPPGCAPRSGLHTRCELSLRTPRGGARGEGSLRPHVSSFLPRCRTCPLASPAPHVALGGAQVPSCSRPASPALEGAVLRETDPETLPEPSPQPPPHLLAPSLVSTTVDLRAPGRVPLRCLWGPSAKGPRSHPGAACSLLLVPEMLP